MITYTVRPTGPLFQDPAVAERIDPAIVALLADAGAYAQRLVVDKTPTGVSSGAGLRGSVFSELRGSPARRSQLVSSSLFYAPIQEVGRRPGKRPPAGALLLWVERKLRVAKKEAPHVEFLIARKIGRVGTRGYRMFEQAFQRAAPYFQRQADALGAALARELGGR